MALIRSSNQKRVPPTDFDSADFVVEEFDDTWFYWTPRGGPQGGSI